MGYNQHQSFFLRDRWTGKGLRATYNNPRFFFEDDAFEKIGLGKNMVQSLQHWLIATESAVSNGIGKERTLDLTRFGRWILKNDPALKRFDTIAMLHYNISSNEEPSTTWYWYFNEYSETIADKKSMFKQLNGWVQERETRVVSENSIWRDIECITRMYASDEQPDDPEEVIVSPFARLNLLEEKNDMFIKREINDKTEDLLFIKYSLCKYSDETNQYEIGLDDLVNKSKLLGKVFNLKTTSIIKALSELENDDFYKITFTRTNNLDMIKLPKLTLNDFLEYYRL